MSVASVRLERWEEIEREIVTNGLARQLFTGKRMMLAHVHRAWIDEVLVGRGR